MSDDQSQQSADRANQQVEPQPSSTSEQNNRSGDSNEDDNAAPLGKRSYGPQDDIRNEQEEVQGKIFIGGLSWQTTEETLRFYFSRYGELSDVALMMDKKTGKPRGFGFIKMKDPKGIV